MTLQKGQSKMRIKDDGGTLSLVPVLLACWQVAGCGRSGTGRGSGALLQ